MKGSHLDNQKPITKSILLHDLALHLQETTKVKKKKCTM